MVGLLGLLLLAVPALSKVTVPWYQNAIIYQLYPRSFQDSDGDGIGDLKGVLQRLDYLIDLGIDAVWFSPIYPSPNKDFGYDISDFTDVSPEYGTLEDFDEIITRLRKKGMKVLLDFVPNHSSTECKWFKWSEAKKTVDGIDYTDFYVWKNATEWKDGKPVPPNNWLGVINTGSAWQWSEKRKQFYLHNFLESQADLNYFNPDVKKTMNEVLRFWLRRGVAGFRVDAVSWLVEDAQYLDEPEKENPNRDNPNDYDNLIHKYTMDQPANLEVIQGWRETNDQFSKVLDDGVERVVILESYSGLDTLIWYYGTDDKPGATFPFNFKFLFDIHKESTGNDWADVINYLYYRMDGRWTNWVLGNHDQMRVANRWTPEWVDILNMALMTLKGTAVSYYGEEIGMRNSIVRFDQSVDIQGIVAGKDAFPYRSRDFERGPMPWNNGTFGGFTNGSATWVPLAPDYWWINVQAQQEADNSHLKVYQKLARLRKSPTLTYGDCQVLYDENIVYIFRSLKDNPAAITIMNIGAQPAFANLSKMKEKMPSEVRLVVASTNFPEYKNATLSSTNFYIPPQAGVVVMT